ncbi:MAG: hypothetical protein KGK30_05580, partial [Elusimicrobia bacterium]|nr:hypothetical protein [Elusimicrobiota bacterium]
KILLVGEQRGYYLEREQVVTSLQAPNGFIAWANAAADPRALAKRLAREGFAEVLYVPRELRRLGSSVGALSARGAANWNDLLRVKPEFQGPACSVYAVPGS